MNPEAKVKTITPSEAKRLLEGNTHNRKVSKMRVEQLTNEILAGAWRLNGESIKMAGGRLIDGQHRLHAIIKAGKPITTLFVTGLSEDVFDTLDQQKKRGANDILSISGETDAANLAAAIRVVVDIRGGNKFKRSSKMLSNSFFTEFMEQEPNIRNSVHHAHATKTLWRIAGVAIPAGMHYLFGLINDTKRDTFFSSLETGLCRGTNDPVFKLREKLIENSAKRDKLERTAIMAYFVKAWNAHVEGRDIKHLRWSSENEDFPAILGMQ